ncbi:MAG TPA: hypothetical protein VFQ15_02100, partial [Jiangellaceae bacterium]|nr:hypothetical protein [Jiangellaceae bacterium]
MSGGGQSAEAALFAEAGLAGELALAGEAAVLALAGEAAVLALTAEAAEFADAGESALGALVSPAGVWSFTVSTTAVDGPVSSLASAGMTTADPRPSAVRAPTA